MFHCILSICYQIKLKTFSYIYSNKFIILITTCIIINSHAYGQEQKIVRDLGLWTEIILSKEVLKDVDLSLSNHLRFNRDISSFDDYILELELEYKINKRFAIGTSGRYISNRHYDETVEDDYRYDLFFKYDTKITEKIKLFYRLQYQKKFYDSSVFNKYLNYFETVYRNRVKIEWKEFNNHGLYASAEIFRMLKKSRDPYFNKYRIFAGDAISIGNNELNVAVGYEHGLKENNPLNLFILKTEWQLKL